MQLNLLISFQDIGDMFVNLWNSSGVMQGDWQNYVMIVISLVLMYLAIVKKFEPLLLLPIAFGMFLINIPGAQAIVWGRYETPDLSLALGKNADGTIEYVAGYAHSVLTDQIIYIREGYLNGDIVTYYTSLADITANISHTMTAADFAQYTLQGYVQGTIDNGILTFAENASYVISHD